MLMARHRAIEKAMTEVADLIALGSLAEPSFAERALAWFQWAPTNSGALGPQLRGGLSREAALAAATERGYRDPCLPPNVHGRRAQIATLTLGLAKAQELLQTEHRQVGRRLDDAREKLVQLLALASREHPIEVDPQVLQSATLRQLQARKVWVSISSNGPETRAVASYLRFAIPALDRYALLDEILESGLNERSVAPPEEAAERAATGEG